MKTMYRHDKNARHCIVQGTHSCISFLLNIISISDKIKEGDYEGFINMPIVEAIERSTC